MNTSSDSLTTRREFLKTSAALGGALAAPAILTGCTTAKPSPSASIKFDKTLRIGLIGCGGRGTGPASQALKADSNVALTPMGDAFEDQLARSLQTQPNEHAA